MCASQKAHCVGTTIIATKTPVLAFKNVTPHLLMQSYMTKDYKGFSQLLSSHSKHIRVQLSSASTWLL